MKKCKVCSLNLIWKQMSFCSYACNNEYYKRKREKKYPIKKKCKECGDGFLLFDAYHNSQIYCSVKCAKTAKSRIEKKRYIDNPRIQKLLYKHKCRQCQKWFKSSFRNSILCNNACYRLYMQKQRLWKKNPAYRSWVYAYKSMTKEQLIKTRHIIIWFWERLFLRNAWEIRDTQIKKFWYYFCEHCKINNSLRWETHHIIYRSERPKHKHLHNKRNLLRLCIGCHNNFHKDKTIRNKYIQKRNLTELFWDWLER